MALLLLLAACAPSPPADTLSPEPLPSTAPEEPTATLVAVAPTSQPTSAASRTPEPVVPTHPAQTAAAVSAATPASPALYAGVPTDRERFGVGGHPADVAVLPVERLGIGWYLSWWIATDPPRPGGIEFWQMVRVSEDGYRPDAAAVQAAARANPGSVWLIGNEPDVRWQDNTTPERYAELYHELYALLKAADPRCRVAIGGVTQPTPLRLAYLDRVLAAYHARFGQPLPVDIWNIHNFILREERGSWGVGIPPGMDDVRTGALYTIEEHDDMDVFRTQIVSFRRWMAERGYRDRPLAVTEYGILMPFDYGFDPARVQAFLYASFDYFLSTRDAETGYPGDDNRLVQWWCWYSLADPDLYPTGNLFDPQTGMPTALGLAFAAYSPRTAAEQSGR